MKFILGLAIAFAFGHCMAGKAPELKGVNYKTSVANNGNLVWMDRDYKFSMLPDYLKDTVLFQVPHKSIRRGTVIELIVHQPSTIYIGHEGSRSGGFTTSLLSAGWELITNKSPLRTGCCTLSNIWKKVVTNSGLTTISLPATTTGETVHSIFVRETEKKCDDLEEWCEEMDKSKDCCSDTVQTMCPGLCDTCPAVHCEWDDWVEGDCSAECGTGTRTNTRVKLVEESNGGTCTGKPTEMLVCKDKECPIHCDWNDWVIGECSESCGGGTRTNARTEKTPAEHGGEECKGPASIDESCNVQECPVDCKWDAWRIGDCSKTCGDGVRENRRVKLTRALFGGNACEGKSKKTESCNNGICPEQCCAENGVPDNCLGLCVEEEKAGFMRRSTFKSVCEKFQGIVDRCTIRPNGGANDDTTKVVFGTAFKGFADINMGGESYEGRPDLDIKLKEACAANFPGSSPANADQLVTAGLINGQPDKAPNNIAAACEVSSGIMTNTACADGDYRWGIRDGSNLPIDKLARMHIHRAYPGNSVAMCIG